MSALAAAAALLGASVQSATGFGFALVLSPALFATAEPREAVGTLLVLGVALNLLVLFEGGRPAHVDWGRLAPMLAAALPGLAFGVLLLDSLSKEALQVAVGVAVIAAAPWQLRHRRVRRLGGGAGLAAGFASGALTTSISVNGPPLVLWLEAHGVRPAEFRVSLAASFLVLNLAGFAVLVASEGAGAVEASTLLPLLVLVILGHLLGTLAFRRLRGERFSVLVLCLVGATGVASVVAGLSSA